MLPDTDYVARICLGSSIDRRTGELTPAAFSFRRRDGHWVDTYLSVQWLEHLLEEGDLREKLQALRQFMLLNPLQLRLMTLKAGMRFAVLPVRGIHLASSVDPGTTLSCGHMPEAAGDPHSGVDPDPGVENWGADVRSPAHLAVQQFLWKLVCHEEPCM